MIEDKEIWACAHQLMRRYGDAAWFHASCRADDLLAANDLDGHRLWLRILGRIEELERVTPKGSIQ